MQADAESASELPHIRWLGGSVKGRHHIAGRALRLTAPTAWRRLPAHVRQSSRCIAPLNRLALRLGASPVAVARMRTGHRMILDLRSGTEWLPYYSGEFDDRRIRVARELMRRRSGVAVDAGANIGLWTVPLALEAAELGGRVIAVEPVPANARRLVQNLRLNRVADWVDVKQVALSDTSGRTTMTLREDFVGGAQTGNAAVFVDDGSDGSWSQTEVATRTLDEVLEDLGRPPVSVVKTDVEGQEDRLLAGAQTTISQNRPIVFAEWNAVYYARRGIDVTKATTPFLRAWDYRCLRRVHQHTWIVDDLFRSRLPLEDVVLVPEEHAAEVVDVMQRVVGDGR